MSPYSQPSRRGSLLAFSLFMMLAASPLAQAAAGVAEDGQRPFVSSGWLLGEQGYRDALRLSERHRVPVLVYAYTDWCQFCRRLESSLLRDVEVNRVLARFVKVKLNPEQSDANRRMFRQWGGRGYPTLFVKAPDESQPGRIRGPFSRHNGRWAIMNRLEFMRLLLSHLEASPPASGPVFSPASSR